MGVALSAALLAGLAAISSLKAGHYANEAMITQIRSANQWSYFQSKSIKEAQLRGKMEILAALGRPIEETDKEKAAEYKREKDEIKKEAEKSEAESHHHLHTHEVMAKSVTLFQVAIAVAAISVLTQRRRFWFVGLAFGTIGIVFLVQGFLAAH